MRNYQPLSRPAIIDMLNRAIVNFSANKSALPPNLRREILSTSESPEKENFSYKNKILNDTYHLVKSERSNGMGRHQIVATNQHCQVPKTKVYIDFSKNKGRGTSFGNPITANQNLFSERMKSTEDSYDALMDIKFNPKYKSNVPSFDFQKNKIRNTEESFKLNYYCKNNYDISSQGSQMRDLGAVIKFEGYSNRSYKGSIYQKEQSPEAWNYEQIIMAKDKLQKRTNANVIASFDKQLDRNVKKVPYKKKKVISIYQTRPREIIAEVINHEDHLN